LEPLIEVKGAHSHLCRRSADQLSQYRAAADLTSTLTHQTVTAVRESAVDCTSKEWDPLEALLRPQIRLSYPKTRLEKLTIYALLATK